MLISFVNSNWSFVGGCYWLVQQELLRHAALSVIGYVTRIYSASHYNLILIVSQARSDRSRADPLRHSRSGGRNQSISPHRTPRANSTHEDSREAYEIAWGSHVAAEYYGPQHPSLCKVATVHSLSLSLTTCIYSVTGDLCELLRAV